MGCMNGLHTPGARSIPLYAAAQWLVLQPVSTLPANGHWGKHQR
jgi:hypothetical protein